MSNENNSPDTSSKNQKRNKRKKQAKRERWIKGESAARGGGGESWVVNLLESMLTPGVDQNLIQTLNIVFLLLFIVLLIMIFLLGSIHYCIMLFFAGGLFFSVQFFLFEASKTPNVLKPSKQQETPKSK